MVHTPFLLFHILNDLYNANKQSNLFYPLITVRHWKPEPLVRHIPLDYTVKFTPATLLI